jgi:hypothetical protein
MSITVTRAPFYRMAGLSERSGKPLATELLKNIDNTEPRQIAVGALAQATRHGGPRRHRYSRKDLTWCPGVSNATPFLSNSIPYRGSGWCQAQCSSLSKLAVEAVNDGVGDRTLGDDTKSVSITAFNWSSVTSLHSHPLSSRCWQPLSSLWRPVTDRRYPVERIFRGKGRTFAGDRYRTVGRWQPD